MKNGVRSTVARQTIMMSQLKMNKRMRLLTLIMNVGETCGNPNEPRLFKMTVIVYDRILLENAFETQLANLGDKTQVLDLHADEFENLSSQFLDEFIQR